MNCRIYSSTIILSCTACRNYISLYPLGKYNPCNTSTRIQTEILQELAKPTPSQTTPLSVCTVLELQVVEDSLPSFHSPLRHLPPPHRFPLPRCTSPLQPSSTISASAFITFTYPLSPLSFKVYWNRSPLQHCRVTRGPSMDPIKPYSCGTLNNFSCHCLWQTFSRTN